MADTNTYDLFQKVEKWTTKEKFNALDPRTIETGTEYNLAGAIDETDLASDLQTKINGKLAKPTNPSAESAVTLSADGTVGTKLLSEIGGGGGKLYLHTYSFTINESIGATISTSFYKSDNIVVSELPKERRYICTLIGEFSGVVSMYVTNNPIKPTVYIIYGVATNGTMITHYDATEVTIERFLGDVITEV